EIERFNLFGFPLTRRQDDNGKVGPFPRPPDDVLAVAIRQAQIEQDDIRRLGGDPFNALGDRSGACHFIVIGLKRRLEEAEDRNLIINDQHANSCAHAGVSSRGNVMTKRAPRPFWTGLSPMIAPPWASMMPFAMARPSPVP